MFSPNKSKLTKICNRNIYEFFFRFVSQQQAAIFQQIHWIARNEFFIITIIWIILSSILCENEEEEEEEAIVQWTLISIYIVSCTTMYIFF